MVPDSNRSIIVTCESYSGKCNANKVIAADFHYGIINLDDSSL